MREFPAWVGHDGLPLSWALYCYGMSRLERQLALESIRTAECVAIAFGGGDPWKEWNRHKRNIAEV